jgi:hypothetical protein
MSLAYSQTRLVGECISVSRDLQLPRNFIITKAIKHVLETSEVDVQVNDLIVPDESEQQQDEQQILHGAQAVTSLKERQAEPEPEEPSPGVTQEVPEL